MTTRYSLDSCGGRYLSGHISKDDGETWQYYNPFIIVGMIVGREMLEGVAHTEVELKDNSIEFTVWWED